MISVWGTYSFTEWDNKHIFYLQDSEKDTMKGIGCGLRCVKEGKKCKEIFIHSFPHFMNTYCVPGDGGTPDTEILTTEHWTW